MNKHISFGYIVALLLSILIFVSMFGRFKRFKPPFEKVVKVVVNTECSRWQGSAVFIDDNLLITAGHMVDGAVNIEIIKSNGKSYTANEWYLEDVLIGDIGLILVDTNEIEPKATFDDAIVGEEVWAIGNPFGAFPVLTKGIISAINMPDVYSGGKSMLITDCPINPGNSGCALFDKDGNILGICSWGYIYSQGMSYFCRAEICELVLEKYYLLKKIERVK